MDSQIRGSLKVMTVADLMEWLARRHKDGEVDFVRGPVKKELFIEDGRAVSAASNDPREFLGQFFINHGIIDEDQLQKAFDTQRETNVLLGKILVMIGLATEEQVKSMLELKIRETIVDIFLWEEGEFVFKEGLVSSDRLNVVIRFDLHTLKREGLERLERWWEIEKAFPRLDIQLQVVVDQVPEGFGESGPAGTMLELVRRGFTIADIALHLHSSDYRVCHLLYEMYEQGYIRPAAEEEITPTPRIQPSEFKLSEVREKLSTSSYADALEMARHTLESRPGSREAARMLKAAEEGLLQELSRELLARPRVPYLIKRRRDLKGYPLTPEEKYIISRIDGKRDIGSIIKVSPMRDLDALRIFSNLIEDKIIAI